MVATDHQHMAKFALVGIAGPRRQYPLNALGAQNFPGGAHLIVNLLRHLQIIEPERAGVPRPGAGQQAGLHPDEGGGGLGPHGRAQYAPAVGA